MDAKFKSFEYFAVKCADVLTPMLIYIQIEIFWKIGGTNNSIKVVEIRAQNWIWKQHMLLQAKHSIINALHSFHWFNDEYML